MPGFVTANVLHKPPLELALRAALAFGVAIWLAAGVGPIVLEALLRYFETVVHLLDDHYWIDFALTYETGHGNPGSDLALLGKASVMRPFVLSAGATSITMHTGQVLKSSTAVGIFMQPAIMIIGLLLGWPARSLRAVLARLIPGAMVLALWLCVGIPLSLWIYFQGMPIKAFAPGEPAFAITAGKFLLNGGGLVVGGLLAAVALAADLRSGFVPADSDAEQTEGREHHQGR